MTSAADPATFESIGPQPVSMLDGSRMLMRGVQGVVGFALILTAVGLWVAPGANWSQELLLIKLLASVTGAMLGVALLQSLDCDTGTFVVDELVQLNFGSVQLYVSRVEQNKSPPQAAEETLSEEDGEEE